MLFAASDRVVLQASVARLRDARSDFIGQPRKPLTRVTASATYHRAAPAGGIWATTIAYAQNQALEAIAGRTLDARTRALLVESSMSLSDRHTVFGRGEVLNIPAHHLHAHEYPDSVFAVAKMQVGYVHHLPVRRGIRPGLGGSLALSVVPLALAPRYSGRAVPSLSVYFNLQPTRHAM